VSGCIITSPLLGLGKNIKFNWIKKQLIQHVGDDLSDFIVGSQVNPTALTKNKQYMHTIFMDRLMLPFMSVKMAKHIFEALSYVQKKGDDFRYPVIVFHGKLDTVTDH
jgi:alpha-beta hydrolase superfamily lysophospholipase